LAKDLAVSANALFLWRALAVFSGRGTGSGGRGFLPLGELAATTAYVVAFTASIKAASKYRSGPHPRY